MIFLYVIMFMMLCQVEIPKVFAVKSLFFDRRFPSVFVSINLSIYHEDSSPVVEIQFQDMLTKLADGVGWHKKMY